MFCPKCGAENPEAVTQCASCAGALPAAWPPRETLFQRPGLVTLLAVVNVAACVFSLASAALLLATGEEPLAWAVGFFFLVWGCVSAMCAHGLLGMRRYGRVLQIFKAVLVLFAFPFGTIVSLMVLFYMLQRHVAILFSERPAARLDTGEVAALEWGARSAVWQAVIGLAVCGLMGLVLLPIFAAIAVPNFLHALERARQKRTLANMRAVAVVLEGHAVDHNAYPFVRNTQELRKAVDEDLLDGVATQDGWEHELWVRTWSDGRSGSGPNRYAVISAGKDGEWERKLPKHYRQGETTRPEEDIVLMDGVFIRAPAGMLR
ncbi:MAG: zinc ribbon domain-containing protein [Acidobacteriota bacterium]|nr:zinc ribbon domain-containing protein [Acidobacteriota bacterium]